MYFVTNKLILFKTYRVSVDKYGVYWYNILIIEIKTIGDGILTLEERLKEAEEKGFISVHVKSECRYFFIESEKLPVQGDIITDSLFKKYKVTEVLGSSRISAEEVE